MKTEYIGCVYVPDGYFGETKMIHLCYDPESLKTLAVWPGGYYTSEVPPAVDSSEASWLISFHPACKNMRNKKG